VANNIVFKINHVKAEYPNENKYAKYIEKRKFYSSNQGYDFVGYVQSGAVNQPVLDFVNYVHDNEKSKGIFGKNGPYNDTEIKSLRNTLSETKSPIWHGFISFEEDFGKKYCNNSDQAIAFFNKQFPRFLSQAGFEVDNITWFAGLHENTNHRHIHFSFFENKPLRNTSKDKEMHFSKGKINKMFLDKAKIDFELSFITNASALIDIRNDILASTKNFFEKEIYLYPKIARKLELLSMKLPKEGRLAYDSENMQMLKKEVDNITTHLLTKSHDLNIKRLEYEDFIVSKEIEIVRICKENKMKPDKYLLKEKYTSDLYCRLGNIVIKSAIKNRSNITKTKSRRYEKMQRKKSVIDWIAEACEMNEKFDKATVNCFQEYREQLLTNERKINREIESDLEMY